MVVRPTPSLAAAAAAGMTLAIFAAAIVAITAAPAAASVVLKADDTERPPFLALGFSEPAEYVMDERAALRVDPVQPPLQSGGRQRRNVDFPTQGISFTSPNSGDTVRGGVESSLHIEFSVVPQTVPYPSVDCSLLHAGSFAGSVFVRISTSRSLGTRMSRSHSHTRSLAADPALAPLPCSSNGCSPFLPRRHRLQNDVTSTSQLTSGRSRYGLAHSLVPALLAPLPLAGGECSGHQHKLELHPTLELRRRILDCVRPVWWHHHHRNRTGPARRSFLGRPHIHHHGQRLLGQRWWWPWRLR